MNHQLDDALEKQDWADMFARLTAYTKKRLGRGGQLADAEEIAAEAIRQVLDPEYRDWKPDEGDLLWHLGSTVNGIIWNRIRTKSRTGEELHDFTLETSDERFRNSDGVVARLDSAKVFERVLDRAIEASDELVQRMIMEALDLVNAPKQLAAKLNEPIGRIYEGRRKFTAYLEAVLQEQEE